jgi:hypothetical protein
LQYRHGCHKDERRKTKSWRSCALHPPPAQKLERAAFRRCRWPDLKGALEEGVRPGARGDARRPRFALIKTHFGCTKTTPGAPPLG